MYRKHLSGLLQHKKHQVLNKPPLTQKVFNVQLIFTEGVCIQFDQPALVGWVWLILPTQNCLIHQTIERITPKPACGTQVVELYCMRWY